jgi:uncharacterized membrane protein
MNELIAATITAFVLSMCYSVYATLWQQARQSFEAWAAERHFDTASVVSVSIASVLFVWGLWAWFFAPVVGR